MGRGSGRQWLPQDQHKVVKCKFKDQEETRATPGPDEDAATDAAANAATPTTQPHGGAAAAAGGVEPASPQPRAWGQGQAGGVGWQEEC